MNATLVASVLALGLGCQDPVRPPALTTEGLDLNAERAHDHEVRLEVGISVALTKLLRTRIETETTGLDAVIRELAAMLCPETFGGDIDQSFPPEWVVVSDRVSCGAFVMPDGTFRSITMPSSCAAARDDAGVPPERNNATPPVFDEEVEREHDHEARLVAAPRYAAFILLRARKATATAEFDPIIRDLSRLICHQDLDFSDIDKVYPPELIDDAATATCGGFFMKNGKFIQNRPPPAPPKPAVPPCPPPSR